MHEYPIAQKTKVQQTEAIQRICCLALLCKCSHLSQHAVLMNVCKQLSLCLFILCIQRYHGFAYQLIVAFVGCNQAPPLKKCLGAVEVHSELHILTAHQSVARPASHCFSSGTMEIEICVAYSGPQLRMLFLCNKLLHMTCNKGQNAFISANCREHLQHDKILTQLYRRLHSKCRIAVLSLIPKYTSAVQRKCNSTVEQQDKTVHLLIILL